MLHSTLYSCLDMARNQGERVRGRDRVRHHATNKDTRKVGFSSDQISTIKLFTISDGCNVFGFPEAAFQPINWQVYYDFKKV